MLRRKPFPFRERPNWFDRVGFPCQSLRRFGWKVDRNTGIVSQKSDGGQRFQTIIGLEIHAQLRLATKLFSGAQAGLSSAAPNKLVEPFDVAVPGFLPSTANSAVHAAVLTAAALRCEVQPVSRFERKHYNYADLPFGYQITQQRWPVARDGMLQWKDHKVRINRIQLEQDTGKTTTTTLKISSLGNTASTQTSNDTISLVDFNRAGCALVEIVLDPDLRSATQAAEAVTTLRNLLKHIGTCDGKMEDGSLRVDLNVSVYPLDMVSENFESGGNRVEVKNLNSIKQVQLAAEYEAIRQASIFSENKAFKETRTFNIQHGKTELIRSKEAEEDYRFIPEPDIPPLVLNESVLEGRSLQQFLDEFLPELPELARQRLVQEHKLSDYQALVLTSDPPAIALFDDAVNVALEHIEKSKRKAVSKAVADLICNEFFALRYDERLSTDDDSHSDEDDESVPFVTGKQIGELVVMRLEGAISSTMAKQILSVIFNEQLSSNPRDVAEERGFILMSDPEQLRQVCREVIGGLPGQLEDYKKGGKFVRKMEKFYFGKVMKQTQGNAHPERLQEALNDVLEELAPGVEA